MLLIHGTSRLDGSLESRVDVLFILIHLFVVRALSNSPYDFSVVLVMFFGAHENSWNRKGGVVSKGPIRRLRRNHSTEETRGNPAHDEDERKYTCTRVSCVDVARKR